MLKMELEIWRESKNKKCVAALPSNLSRDPENIAECRSPSRESVEIRSPEDSPEKNSLRHNIKAEPQDEASLQFKS